jgi:hypothetical protein
MISTKEAEATCTYLGVDITDRFRDSARLIDVCGLEISGDKFIPHFWTWCWGPRGSTNVTELFPEVKAAKAVMTLSSGRNMYRSGRGLRTLTKQL